MINPLLQRIKTERPLILNITNAVTMDFIANGLLSLGASPIMTQSLAEIEDLVTIASGVVINIGTLNDEFIALCEQTCRVANALGKPIVLDPVGAGASRLRTLTCLDLLEKYTFATIRGNASEIMALGSSHNNNKGVDSSLDTETVISAAQTLSSEHQCVVVMSGETDVVIDGEHMRLLKRGSPLMPMVTGCGCLLTAVVSAFQSRHANRFDAACAAVTFYGICGELAAQQAQGPGSFKALFIDALARLLNGEDTDEAQ